VSSDHPLHVCKLDKALYGLKQVPRVWYSRLSVKLLQFGFVVSKVDTSLFAYIKSGLIIYLLVNVDDIIVTISSDTAVTTLLSDHWLDFALKDLGNLHHFLGVQVTRSKQDLTLFQEHCAKEILQWAGMHKCKPVKPPLVTSEKLSVGNGTTLGEEESIKYRSIVGGLQYLTLTRRDLSFAVNLVCQFLHSPTDLCTYGM
jgi:hypothetical protein